MKSLMLFLGSGVSYASGAPTVGKITCSLLHDEWFDKGNLSYWPGKNRGGTPPLATVVPRLQECLRILKAHSDGYLAHRCHRESTYEDLFYLAERLHNDVTGETDDPAIGPFVENMTKELHHLCDEALSWNQLTRRTTDFIRWVVYHQLKDCQTPLKMDLIRGLAASDEVERLDIVTLNHDVLVERLLEGDNIPFTDGFQPDNGFARFAPELFENTTAKVRLFKLHGSIDWRSHRDYRYVKVQGDQSGRLLKNADGAVLDEGIDPGGPLILLGTLNKTFAYGFGANEILFYDWFRRLLETYQTIVMSGFGWGDDDICLRIRNWLRCDKTRRLVLLYEDPERDVRNRPGSHVNLWWSDQLNLGQLELPKKWLRDTTIADLLKLNVIQEINWD